MNTSHKEVGEFFNAWTIYRKVLTNNYMHHRGIYQAVTTLLNDQWAMQPFKLLDLGCGDASFIAQALHGASIQHYVGFDLSDPALALAAENIAPLGCQVELINIDFMEGLAQTKERFDIVFTSYALHHLSREEKAEFFRLAHGVLTENGLLLIIDVMRESNESLPSYLDNYCQWVREEWLQLDEQELTAIIQHIRHNDLPENVAILSALAEAERFYPATSIYHMTWHQALLFSKIPDLP
ncbi:class I SAM-dependent methyltransferase [Methylobacter sp. S3L5C]|uniref:class I SAM-dependent methyltransferase n=1 Tax=Methylobacter sp. S3L5C TaxID=2839024 RepID=UPI001FAC4ACB|nr:class I SAM-dependent methyltransferase [Methylobacter sp. S3L5C]UOA08059.1 class I SAM-dependent methyltransferase [Methylobacter sp. S3L5C]